MFYFDDITVLCKLCAHMPMNTLCLPLLGIAINILRQPLSSQPPYMQELSQAWYKGVVAQRSMAWGPYQWDHIGGDLFASPEAVGFGPGFGCIGRHGAKCQGVFSVISLGRYQRWALPWCRNGALCCTPWVSGAWSEKKISNLMAFVACKSA